MAACTLPLRPSSAHSRPCICDGTDQVSQRIWWTIYKVYKDFVNLQNGAKLLITRRWLQAAQTCMVQHSSYAFGFPTHSHFDCSKPFQGTYEGRCISRN